MTSRRAAELIAVILAALVGIFAPAAAEATAVQMLGTTATKAPYTYDGLTISRVDVYAPDGAAGAAPQLSDVREGSPSTATAAVRASTTPSATGVATEVAGVDTGVLHGPLEPSRVPIPVCQGVVRHLV